MNDGKTLDVRITKKQNDFMSSEAFETLFGGAAPEAERHTHK